jgi:hypothetical protein
MDCLTKYRGTIACAERTVIVTNHLGITVTCHIQSSVLEPTLHTLKVESPEQIPVVKEYPDVFPEELPSLPPNRDIEFAIDLALATAPIVKRPYRMATPELKELNKQLNELEQKGYVRPSSSPWVAPALFVEKKDKS